MSSGNHNGTNCALTIPPPPKEGEKKGDILLGCYLESAESGTLFARINLSNRIWLGDNGALNCFDNYGTASPL
ncbi:uncharacterized protein CLUP02_17717 [Colletotrichum lupini]|uniref:Uncharacterized protein n=1 Tax=Colletotrichum lupini TaxID=145971 RepID=A0A9Q8SF26_9PEZI|nr:uncharacterized protein CLUP02_17717 [Colletotrichum lupini]UQC76204.1 hypothetical protein CLUP02_17717 [Colletotrichum lupini]